MQHQSFLNISKMPLMPSKSYELSLNERVDAANDEFCEFSRRNDTNRSENEPVNLESLPH